MLNGWITSYVDGYITGKELKSHYDDAYAYLYENSAPRIVYDALVALGEKATREHNAEYRAFCRARNDHCISDRELAAYALAFCE